MSSPCLHGPGKIRTYGGRIVAPFDLKHEDIDLDDIAHALSNECRYGGHCRFISVAQHSVLVARHLPIELQLWGLLHDGSEAYLKDIPKPLKVLPQFAFYREAEERILQTISERFDLPWPIPAQVEEADARAWATEWRDVCIPTQEGTGPRWEVPPANIEPYAETIDPWSPPRAYDWFIAKLLPHVEPEELPRHQG